MTFRGSRERRLRVVAIADADSFVKWSAHLIDRVPDISRHLLLVRTPLTVSEAQEQAALAGTRFAGDPASVTRIDFGRVASWLGADRPDVVVLAGRGPFVRLLGREIDRLPARPVVVSGLPGMSIPAQRGALDYRRHSDLLVVHSWREVAAFTQLGRRIGVDVPIALATLPFARRTDAAGQRVRGTEADLLHTPGTDLVFAAQALVPATRGERLRMAEILRLAAVAEPSKRVVVKLRSRPGEAETHHERDAYPELLQGAPDNLVLSYQPMSEALATAEGLVTVSSTAAVEAIAHGVPVIAVDEFGVSKALLNHVFRGSGLLGGAEDVVARRFRHPDPGWAAQNYFHDPRDSQWWAQVRGLVAQRRRGELPSRVVPRPRGGALHAAWHRRLVLGEEDRTLSGALAGAVGAPLVSALVAVRRRRGGTDAGSWQDAGSDLTLAPTPLAEPVRRRTAASLAIG
ncbi:MULTISPECIES: DUF6716 putative glycosyltransferase [Microbacterium]|uniref:DUF6716 putative glycosyltransferase n=1 Tax=Microbacterium TaxID=33882 RepID=UPI00217CE4FF|nr:MULTISPECIES: DUF6716 putative glycosyltransferase [Microbacterium]UWF77498.1 hypothetical protein JSY13_12265 [Microbacterium neungamense]WCM55661.1 hypothetical protein JRG78_12275 [Microbacterium sp. EF45047]